MDPTTDPTMTDTAPDDGGLPQPGEDVTLDDGTVGTVAQIGEQNGAPVIILEDGRVVDPSELDPDAGDDTDPEADDEPMPPGIPAAACGCGSRTAAGDNPASAVLAAISDIAARLDRIEAASSTAAAPVIAAQRAAVDAELADVDGIVASMVIVTIKDAPPFRAGDIVTLPTGEEGFVDREETAAMFGSDERLVYVNCAMEDVGWDNTHTVLVPASQLTPTGKVRDRTWVDDDSRALAIIDESTGTTPPPPAAAPDPEAEVTG